MKKFSTAVVIVGLLLVSGCGGGGGGSALNVKSGGDRLTISGTVGTPSGVTLSRPAGRDAGAMQGLVAPANGAPVSLYKIDEEGTLSGSALASGATSGGSFTLTLPEGMKTITSDMVVVAGTGSNAMRAFVVSTGALQVSPVSEFVVSMVAGRTTPLSQFTVAELTDIYTRVAAKAAERGIDFASVSSAAGAKNALYADSYIKQETADAVVEAEDEGYCDNSKLLYCTDESAAAPGPLTAEARGVDADAWGSIMHDSYVKINSVKYLPAIAGLPCTVKAKLSFIGAEDEDAVPEVYLATLQYSVDGGAEQGVTMTFKGSGEWTADIPSMTKGKTVKFYVKVIDSNGNTTTGAISSSTGVTYGFADVDNSADIVPDDMDLLDMGVNYDNERIYVSYKVQGNVSGGTVDPPYIHIYGIKITNPDIEQNEGLMVGKLLVNMPSLKDKAVQDKLLTAFLQKETIEKLGSENINKVNETGLVVADIGKLLGGNIIEGLLFSADPQGTSTGGTFTGSIKRSALGENPSGMIRILTMTLANASLDSFMPIPLNCSHFITLYTTSYGYTVR